MQYFLREQNSLFDCLRHSCGSSVEAGKTRKWPVYWDVTVMDYAAVWVMYVWLTTTGRYILLSLCFQLFSVDFIFPRFVLLLFLLLLVFGFPFLFETYFQFLLQELYHTISCLTQRWEGIMLLKLYSRRDVTTGGGATGRAEKFWRLVKGLCFQGPAEIIMAMSLTC